MIADNRIAVELEMKLLTSEDAIKAGRFELF
jgi:hypothetical protein